MLADRLVVMDAGQVLQQGPPAAIHRAPRNARVADLVGIQNRFQGRWVGPSGQAGWGLLQWSGRPGGVPTPAALPLLTVRDKGRIDAGQAVHWVLSGDAITLLERPPQARRASSAPSCPRRGRWARSRCWRWRWRPCPAHLAAAHAVGPAAAAHRAGRHGHGVPGPRPGACDAGARALTYPTRPSPVHTTFDSRRGRFSSTRDQPSALRSSSR